MISWSARITPFKWISAGFAVEERIMTGSAFTCKGGPGTYMAVWKQVGQTAYTVKNRITTCISNSYSDDYVMWSPNSNDRGSRYYCVVGQRYVREKGDRWLDTHNPVRGSPL
ncbi:hypothetical protein PspLS_08439 [Pyricularia sp. CBS 133598]|nr:hypothetical protein PspLS_08439 [Pyricularia sp. CBS 133598]